MGDDEDIEEDDGFPALEPLLPNLLNGEATFTALQQAFDELKRTAPENYDVVIEAFNLTVRELRYVEPHTLVFRCLGEHGKDSFVIAHYSQVVARVVYRPRQTGEPGVITGFSRG